MNKTMKYLSMAALALVGAVMTSCSSDDELLQPTNPGKVITLSTTVNLDNGSGTRALNPTTGAKTFAEGETMALRYMSASGWKKAVSHALTISDIDGGTSATFTFDLEDPVKTQPVSYVYPASMADEDGDIDLTLLSTQDGTLGTLESNFDLAYNTGAWVDGESLPGLTLENQLAILAIKLKNSGDSEDITDEITEMIVSDGTNIYTVNRTAADGPIYVAIKPTLNANITVTATGGSKYYMKTLSNKTYEKNNVYPVNWRMPESVVNGKFTINAGGDKVQFAKGNLRCVNASVSSWSWSFFDTQDGYYNQTEFDGGKWDLFGWVGQSSRLKNSEPVKWGVNTSKIAEDYGTTHSEDLASDWGNVPGIGSGWRTLTQAEWDYLFNTRTASNVNGTPNARYTYATINTDGTSVNGVILFPDGATIAAGEATTWGNINSESSWGTKCTSAQWSALEAKGCVFLPAAGYRDGSTVKNAGSNGCYWSSSPYYAGNFNYAYNVYFDSGLLNPAYNSLRNNGQSVRLVR